MTDEGQVLEGPPEGQKIPTVGELQELIEEMIVAVEEAKAVPLSGNVMVDREEMRAMLVNLRDRLPEELRAARWMIREREAFVARTNERARGIVDRAKLKADELVSESHVLAEAVDEANALIRRAEGEARRIRLEAEDFSDERLEYLEGLFAKLLSQVQDARAQFHEARPAEPPPPGH
jgi:cell division septum initiation protein DivIVA